MSGMMLPNPLFTNHYGESGRGLSPRLWSKIAAHGSAPDGSQGIFASDDFLSIGQSVAVSSNIACYSSFAGQYKTYEDTSTSVAQIATATGGVLRMALNAGDNQEISICQGGAGTSAAAAVLGPINVASSPKPVIFEARFRMSSIADDAAAIFIGLMEENGAVHNAKVDDTGATIDNDFIGFETVHTNGGTTGANATLNFVWKKDGATKVTLISGVKTLVADTWYKVGFVYQPLEAPSKRLAVFVDNVEQTTYGTYTQLSASTFPDGEELGFTAIAKTGSATASNVDLDWWAAYLEV